MTWFTSFCILIFVADSLLGKPASNEVVVWAYLSDSFAEKGKDNMGVTMHCTDTPVCVAPSVCSMTTQTC